MDNYMGDRDIGITKRMNFYDVLVNIVNRTYGNVKVKFIPGEPKQVQFLFFYDKIIGRFSKLDYQSSVDDFVSDSEIVFSDISSRYKEAIGKNIPLKYVSTEVLSEITGTNQRYAFTIIMTYEIKGEDFILPDDYTEE